MELMAVIIFIMFVVAVLALSFYFANKTKSAKGYFAAGGSIHWSVNGIAFAGDYLSAASFLGICGMIAIVGYDGFLYSIGYLAGWIVALFVVAEPMKRLGKYTFTDALDSKFNSKGIQLAAAISTLLVSLFYLIPQMVGAGVLVTPLLGLPHWVGVLMVGTIVIIIVASAGMTSTTYVQFLKGGMLIIFSTIIVGAICIRGLDTKPKHEGNMAFYKYGSIKAYHASPIHALDDPSYKIIKRVDTNNREFYKLTKDKISSWWVRNDSDNGITTLEEGQYIKILEDGGKIINGAPESSTNKLRPVGNLEKIKGDPDKKTGPLNIFSFLSTISHKDTVVRRWQNVSFPEGKSKVTVFYPVFTAGSKIMRPGLSFKLEGTFLQKIDFISLMLALFLGTAALPHILIRYYTVPSPACARKSTIVAIATIGFFYILTLYMGLGAMTGGMVNLLDNNMAGPLLAKSFGTFLFAIISAIAFATVLGTVSGLIIASSGAVAHDLFDRFANLSMNEKQKVMVGKLAALAIGAIAIILGIIFQGMNVSFLVGWAFAVAASANLPAIIMLLFWKKTTAKGIVASIFVGAISAIGLILFSPSMYVQYGLNPQTALVPFSNPGIISIPLSFITLVFVSLKTQKTNPLKIF